MEPTTEGGVTQSGNGGSAPEASHVQEGQLGEAPGLEDVRGLFERCARIRFSGRLALLEGVREAEVTFVAGRPQGAVDLFKLGAIWRHGAYRLEQRAVDVKGRLGDGITVGGALVDTGSLELLRYCEDAQLSAALEFDSGDGRSARARFVRGRLESAELDGQPNVGALAVLSGWAAGSYRLTVSPLFGGEAEPPPPAPVAAPVTARPVALGAGPPPALDVASRVPLWQVEADDAARGHGASTPPSPPGEGVGLSGPAGAGGHHGAPLGPGGLPSLSPGGLPPRPSLFTGANRPAPVPSRPNPFAAGPLRPSLAPGLSGDRRGLGAPRTLPPVGRPLVPRSPLTTPPQPGPGVPSLLARPPVRPLGTPGSLLRGEAPPAAPLLGEAPAVSGWDLPESLPPPAPAEGTAAPTTATAPPAEGVAGDPSGAPPGAGRWSALTPAAVAAVPTAIALGGVPGAAAGTSAASSPTEPADAASLLAPAAPVAAATASRVDMAHPTVAAELAGSMESTGGASAVAPAEATAPAEAPGAVAAVRPDTVPIELVVPSHGKPPEAHAVVVEGAAASPARAPSLGAPPASPAAAPPRAPAPAASTTAPAGGGVGRYVAIGLALAVVALVAIAVGSRSPTSEPSAAIVAAPPSAPAAGRPPTTASPAAAAPAPLAAPRPAPAGVAPPGSTAPRAPAAAAPAPAAAPDDPVRKLIFAARKATTDGDRAEALRLFRAAYKINQSDPGFAIFVPMARGKTGAGTLVLDGPGVVTVDGNRYSSPRKLTLAAGPHRVVSGSRSEELVLDKGGTLHVTATEPPPAAAAPPASASPRPRAGSAGAAPVAPPRPPRPAAAPPSAR